MMGSGKTTVGKLMSKVLGYSFFDWYVYAMLFWSCVNTCDEGGFMSVAC